MKSIEEQFVGSNKALASILMKRFSIKTFDYSKGTREHIMQTRDMSAQLKSLRSRWFLPTHQFPCLGDGFCKEILFFTITPTMVEDAVAFIWVTTISVSFAMNYYNISCINSELETCNQNFCNCYIDNFNSTSTTTLHV